MKLPSKTICQLSTLARSLSDPNAIDFEHMEKHEMLELVADIAKSHTELEERELDASSAIMSVNDSAIDALDAIKNGAPATHIEQYILNILEVIHGGDE
jgi:hypothetical protein